MKILIGYPKELLNDSLVTEFFKDVGINLFLFIYLFIIIITVYVCEFLT